MNTKWHTPKEFSFTQFDEVNMHVGMSREGTVNYKEFAGGHNGVKIRFFACCEFSNQFVHSISKFGNAPALERGRFAQENNLFGFFVSGLSTLECFGYCIHFMANMINPGLFQTSSLQGITLEKTSNAYLQAYPNHPFSTSLQDLLSSADFKEWKDLRNILAHRSAPGRDFFVGDENYTNWQAGEKKIRYDKSLTETRLNWLKLELQKLITAAHQFSSSQLKNA